MNKIILHIGSPKTGTTSIQKHLNINSDLYFKKGYFIPEIYGAGVNSWPLTFPFMNDERFEIMKSRLRHLNYSDQITKYELKNKYQEQFLYWKEHYKGMTLLTSSEDYFSNLRTKNEIKEFSEFINKFFDEIKIILYIREPLSRAISEYSDKSKKGRKLIFPMDLGIIKHDFGFKDNLVLWMNFFKNAIFKINLFQKGDLFKNDIICDFQKNLGLESEYKPIEDLENVSLNHKSILILNEINKRFLKSKDNLVANSLLLETLDIIYSNYPKFKVSKEIYDFYNKLFEDDNEWLKKNFFNHKKKLWDARSDFFCEKTNLDLNSFDFKFIDYVVRNRKSFLKFI